MKYRPEIDGLRAIAILPVLLFHANASAFTGGFVGVDVFFVISGFLITNIILSEIKEQKFSLFNFYYRRILRIFPALFVVMMATLIAGYFIQMPENYNDTAKSLFYASFSLSNVYFFLESSYFSGTSLLKPALHTWSLAVEEQFYIFFPLLMMIVARFKNGLPIMLISVIVISFIASVYVTTVKPDAAFYLLPFRAWELGIGAFLAFNILPKIENKKYSEVITWLGFLMIGWAVFYYTPETAFPGMAALLPCIGAFLIIWGTGNANTYAAALLRTPLLLFFGAISYSLYLWHWPIFAFLQNTQIYPLDFFWQSGIATIISIAVAYLSYRFVETPFRKGRKVFKLWPVLICGCASMAVVAVLSAGVAVKDGFPQRYSKEVNDAFDRYKGGTIDAEECTKILDFTRYTTDKRQCRFGDLNKETTVAIIGDSHADSYTKMMDKLGRELNIGMVNMIAQGCQPIFDITPVRETSRTCEALRDYNKNYIEQLSHLKTVIIAGRWPVRLEGRVQGLSEQNFNVGMSSLLNEEGDLLSTEEAKLLLTQKLQSMVDQFEKRGIKVIIIYPSPEAPYDIPWAYALLKSQGKDLDTLNIPYTSFVNRASSSNEVLDALKGNIVRIYPDKYLCDGKICKVYEQDTIFYKDDDHLSQAGAGLMKDEIRNSLLSK